MLSWIRRTMAHAQSPGGVRLGLIAALLAVIGATTAAATMARTGLPDIGKQYYERQNCHGAYDVLVEQMKAGTSLTSDETAWGKSYEAAAEQGKPCPAPPETLARRATNRMVVTLQGLGQLAKYHKQGDPVAYYEAALAVLNGKVQGVEAPVGWELLQQAVKLGDPTAQFLTASLYITGQATGKPDYATALPLIEKAAQSGHVDALFMAANFYKEGMGGVKKDARKAFDYYRQAAERGHIYAAYLAAYMVNDGDGIKADHDLAYRLARNLADQGQPVGAVIAASALLQQKNAKDKENEVLYWMDLAIRDGDDDIRTQVSKFRPQVVAAFKRANAPPEYHPRVRKICGKKTVCLVNHFTGLQSCTTNTDYWSDCDTGLGAP